MTSNTKCVGSYLRSLLITAIVTFVLPLMLLGVMQVILLFLRILFPELPAFQQAVDYLRSFLVIFGNGNPWRGGLLVGVISSLVGMLFDTYTFYRYQGINHSWFD